MLLLWNKGVPISPYIWTLLPSHIEFLLIGWTVQLALGVAFWILPRWQTQRGDVRPAWAAFCPAQPRDLVRGADIVAEPALLAAQPWPYL